MIDKRKPEASKEITLISLTRSPFFDSHIGHKKKERERIILEKCKDASFEGLGGGDSS